MKKRTKAITAIPPTTPPAMVPLFGCPVDASASGVDVAVADAVEFGADANRSTLFQEM